MWQKSSGRTCATDYLGTERLRLTPSLTLTRYSESERTKLTMPRRSPISTETSRAHATGAEFCKAFAENIDSMHVLSFLLTADLTKAEKCFVSGLEDCATGSYVFRDWARSWARRTIIQNAVRMLAPGANQSAATGAPSETASCGFGQTPEAHAAIASILGLEDFERFVFVMSVLESYSDQDCSVLLGCSRQDVREARIRALQHVAESTGHIATVSRTWTGSDNVITAPLPARSEIPATPPCAWTTASTKASPRP
jgi:hypothetical protein